MRSYHPSVTARDRQQIADMTAKWIAENGPPRKFKTGASSSFEALQSTLASLGYVLAMDKAFYTVAKSGAGGRKKRMKRPEEYSTIDDILSAHGIATLRAPQQKPNQE